MKADVWYQKVPTKRTAVVELIANLSIDDALEDEGESGFGQPNGGMLIPPQSSSWNQIKTLIFRMQ